MHAPGRPEDAIDKAPQASVAETHNHAIARMDFRFDGGVAVAPFAPVLVGVVGSGNLEVLLESDADAGCTIQVETSARGFDSIWQAVLADFHERHGLAGIRVSINDMGATPAVVSLRLQQAAAQLERSAP